MQAKLGSRSLDSFKLRRHLLHGAVVVFVTAGYSGKRFIFEKVAPTCSITGLVDSAVTFALHWELVS